MRWLTFALCLLLGCKPSASREQPVVAVSAPTVQPSREAARALPTASLVALQPRAPVPTPELPPDQIFKASSSAPLEKRPLVLFLHGLGADGKLAFELLKLAEFGARKRINIIAPNGTLDSAGRRFWNAGPACCNFDHKDIDDVARISALVEEWARDPGVDSARLYLVGYSNGGFMAHRLACIRGQPFAAVVSIAGAVTADAECHVDANLALLEVHGDADPSVHFEGGKVFDRADLAPFLGAQAGFSKWAERLGCEGKPVSGPRLDLVPNLPAAETETRSYANCRRGTVALWTVHGGNHYVGVRSSILEPIWEFLNSHAR